MLAQAGFR